MTISHRAAPPASAAEVPKPEKVARVACCCKLADLLPLVRQLHRQAARPAAKGVRQSEAA